MKPAIPLTYSDRIAPLRQFLYERRARPLTSYEIHKEDANLETWSIDGMEILFVIAFDGSFTALAKLTESREPDDVLRELSEAIKIHSDGVIP